MWSGLSPAFGSVLWKYSQLACFYSTGVWSQYTRCQSPEDEPDSCMYWCCGRVSDFWTETLALSVLHAFFPVTLFPSLSVYAQNQSAWKEECMQRREVTCLRSRLVCRRKKRDRLRETHAVADFRKKMAQQCVTVSESWQNPLSTAKWIIMFHTQKFNSEKPCQRRKLSW